MGVCHGVSRRQARTQASNAGQLCRVSEERAQTQLDDVHGGLAGVGDGCGWRVDG